MINMSYSHLLFDLDGTVIDSHEGIFNCLKYAFEAYGFPYGDDEGLKVFIGPPLFEQIRAYTGANDETSRLMVAKYRERYRPIGAFENRLYDGIVDAVRELKARGKKLYLATSKPEEFARAILERHGIDILFDEICGANLSRGAGTKEEVITELFSRTGICKDDCIMIGDTHFDVDGAKTMGIASMGVTWGFGSRDELESSGADIIVNSPEELLTMLP